MTAQPSPCGEHHLQPGEKRGEESGGLDQLAARVQRSALLAQVPGVVHGLTGRVPELGEAEGNIGYSPPRDTAEAWAMRQRWSSAVGVDAERLVTAGQVHGTEVLRVGVADAGHGARPGSGRAGIGDALMTDEAGVVLMTLHADCLPILLLDPQGTAVAAVHAGWRGTLGNVAGRTVEAMTGAYGSRPERLLAFLGAGIGPCCYEVGPEVVEGWMERGAVAGQEAGVAIRELPGGTAFDLKKANSLLLRQAGVLQEHIDVHPECTRCQGDRWFSHRGQGATTGRAGAMIALAGIGPHGGTR